MSDSKKPRGLVYQFPESRIVGPSLEEVAKEANDLCIQNNQVMYSMADVEVSSPEEFLDYIIGNVELSDSDVRKGYRGGKVKVVLIPGEFDSKRKSWVYGMKYHYLDEFEVERIVSKPYEVLSKEAVILDPRTGREEQISGAKRSGHRDLLIIGRYNVDFFSTFGFASDLSFFTHERLTSYPKLAWEMTGEKLKKYGENI